VFSLKFIDYTKQDLTTYLTQNPPSPKFHAIFEAVGLADSSLYAQSNKYLAPGGIYVTVGPQPSSFSDIPKMLSLVGLLLWPKYLGGVSGGWR
jgi:hypothetical protein